RDFSRSIHSFPKIILTSYTKLKFYLDHYFWYNTDRNLSIILLLDYFIILVSITSFVIYSSSTQVSLLIPSFFFFLFPSLSMNV
ncbi:MAG: hypothetical protein ABI851_10955, partial [Saprospiraceae bacterium]